jgi:26S proteasome regulatory subunit N2
MAHALMHLGTTVDVFLRENLEWLGKATNWAKFTATASIGAHTHTHSHTHTHTHTHTNLHAFMNTHT